MIYKRCSRCRTRLDYSTICSCKAKYKTNSDSYKDDKEKKFYKSKAWQDATNIIKNKFNYIDIHSYYVLGQVEQGEVVHHIIALDEDFNKRLSLSNLIYLTEKNHRIIHNLMKKSPKDKEDVQHLLFSLIKRFNIDFK
ncbi:HNH endonuclease [uncultured Tyzzerella sp.]|uniref:HNH endonuclease n=1 Tax=uncultured Tyzzerella sp. TaxID=2321398 RepID=UPI0029424390|nr:HNH endonuclease [uncultured Tyzzerella sp.]